MVLWIPACFALYVARTIVMGQQSQHRQLYSKLQDSNFSKLQDSKRQVDLFLGGRILLTVSRKAYVEILLLAHIVTLILHLDRAQTIPAIVFSYDGLI